MKKIIVEIICFFVNRKIHSWANSPKKFQMKTFKYLLKMGKQTTFGTDHNFDLIKSYEDYKKNVPIHTYEDLTAYIDQIQSGESDVLWPGIPSYMGTTSGTTAGEKYIPVTMDFLNKGMKCTSICTANYLSETKDLKTLTRKFVSLTCSQEVKERRGISTGKITGIFNRHTPGFMNKIKLPTPETNMIDDWNEKLAKTVEESLGGNIGAVGGVPAWIVRYFEKVLEISGKKTIMEVFPDFSLLIHGGASFGPYKERMDTLIGKEVNRIEVYSATEGFVSFKDKLDQDDMLLVTDGGLFYEFIPAEDIGKENPRRLPLWEVEVGVNYSLLLTNFSGLWSYAIGDTVEFTSIKPYRIRVTGRVKHFISLTGEHLISKQVEDALCQTIKKENLEVRDFTVAPRVREGENPSHEWFIEFDKAPEDLKSFEHELCKSLGTINNNYMMYREANIIGCPVVTPLKKEAFVEYMSSIGKMTNQNKVPRLSNNREVADQLSEWTLN